MYSYLKDWYQYRALIGGLVNKDLKLRYRGSVLGFLWSFLNPLLLMAVYALVFFFYLRIDMDNYAVFLFCGLLPWIWFSSSLMEGSTAIIGGGSLVTKSMLPPHILPMVKVLSNLMNFLFSLPILLVFMLAFGVPVKVTVLVLPVIMLVQLFFTVGLVMILSALTVHFRDLQHVIANLLTLWFFVSPILYPLSVIPEKFRFTVNINPMGLLAQAYQNIFFYHHYPVWKHLLVVLLISAVIFMIGVRIFDHYRDTFAEEI